MQPDSASLPQVYQKFNFWVFTNVMKFYRFREISWIFCVFCSYNNGWRIHKMIFRVSDDY